MEFFAWLNEVKPASGCNFGQTCCVDSMSQLNPRHSVLLLLIAWYHTWLRDIHTSDMYGVYVRMYVEHGTYHNRVSKARDKCHHFAMTFILARVYFSYLRIF